MVQAVAQPVIALALIWEAAVVFLGMRPAVRQVAIPNPALQRAGTAALAVVVAVGRHTAAMAMGWTNCHLMIIISLIRSVMAAAVAVTWTHRIALTVAQVALTAVMVGKPAIQTLPKAAQAVVTTAAQAVIRRLVQVLSQAVTQLVMALVVAAVIMAAQAVLLATATKECALSASRLNRRLTWVYMQ